VLMTMMMLLIIMILLNKDAQYSVVVVV
jgi:hypothetical protein